jgi:uncharacterized protein YkwD
MILGQFNLIDLLVFGFLAYFVWSGYEQGLTLGLLNLLRTVVAFLVSLIYYPEMGSWLSSQFSLAQPVGQVLAFVMILLVLEVVLGLLINHFHKNILQFLFKIKPLLMLDKVLGIIPSVIIGLVLISTFTLLPLILPVSAKYKEPVKNSWWGQHVVPQAATFEPALESLLQRLPTRNLIYIVTRTPGSEETVPIEIPNLTKLSVSQSDEEAMLVLVNQERVSRGLKPLEMDQTVVAVARKHSEDMFKRGYFSHYNPDKESPFDRMDKGGVEYDLAGENLAYAPTVEIAHRGLMNSPGHRENILKEDYGKVGIGVIEAGLYGKMFTQNFTD